MVRIKNINSSLYLGSISSDICNGTKCCLVNSSDATSQFYISALKSDPNQLLLWNTQGKLGLPIECENGNLGNSTKIQFWNSGLDRITWKIQAY